MKVVKSPRLMAALSNRFHAQAKTIGFVATMGCLHNGHLSLIKRALRDTDVVVASIFVNPRQFGPKEDFHKYPRNFKRDCSLAKRAGCDIIFYPSVNAMYPEGFSTRVNAGRLNTLMCGIARPAHFEGVTTVCAKLFNIVKPDIAYFGQKDYQQSVIIKKIAKDLNMDLKIKVMPIIREANRLAMSSRNLYLSPRERKDAAVLYKSLKSAAEAIKKGKTQSIDIKLLMRKMILERPGIKLDYIVIADPDTLEKVKNIKGRVLIALAARVGKTRLIDNIIISV